MIEAPALDIRRLPTTDGGIAVNNLESARKNSWIKFWQAPERTGIAECIVEQEQLTAQFLGDLGAFDRLDALVRHLACADAESSRTALIQAQFAAMTHRFAEARDHVAQADFRGAPPVAINRLFLSIDQACGTQLDAVLEARRRMAKESGSLEDWVPLGALLADLGEFAQADRVYKRALQEYADVSPFAVAWVCFQLGALWGELVPEPELSRAAQWYRNAIDYLPCYVKARVHLAEIYAECGRCQEAEALLVPAVASGDPEVHWRLADVLVATGRIAEGQVQRQAARSGFEALLKKYLLAFADHGAEFYAGSGNDPRRAFALASANLANRPTLRAFEQAHATALDAGESLAAADLVDAARERWGATAAFAASPLGRRAN